MSQDPKPGPLLLTQDRQPLTLTLTLDGDTAGWIELIQRIVNEPQLREKCERLVRERTMAVKDHEDESTRLRDAKRRIAQLERELDETASARDRLDARVDELVAHRDAGHREATNDRIKDLVKRLRKRTNALVVQRDAAMESAAQASRELDGARLAKRQAEFDRNDFRRRHALLAEELAAANAAAELSEQVEERDARIDHQRKRIEELVAQRDDGRPRACDAYDRHRGLCVSSAMWNSAERQRDEATRPACMHTARPAAAYATAGGRERPPAQPRGRPRASRFWTRRLRATATAWTTPTPSRWLRCDQAMSAKTIRLDRDSIRHRDAIRERLRETVMVKFERKRSWTATSWPSRTRT